MRLIGMDLRKIAVTWVSLFALTVQSVFCCPLLTAKPTPRCAVPYQAKPLTCCHGKHAAASQTTNQTPQIPSPTCVFCSTGSPPTKLLLKGGFPAPQAILSPAFTVLKDPQRVVPTTIYNYVSPFPSLKKPPGLPRGPPMVKNETQFVIF